MKISLKSEASQEASDLAQSVVENGYVYIPFSHYLNEQSIPDLLQLQASYFTLSADEYGGGRFRAYGKLLFSDQELTITQESAYAQSEEYNPDLGGKVRKMEPIAKEIMQLPLMQGIIKKDLKMAKKMDLLDFNRPVRIGLHQVRYLPTNNSVSFISYSSSKISSSVVSSFSIRERLTGILSHLM